MFINTFKFPNHSSLLRTMFTNPPYQIATPGVYHAATTLYIHLQIKDYHLLQQL